MTARPLRVLLVEDCENDALLLERELRGSCNTLLMRRVDTPEELHDALKKPEWDVILTDHNLPGFNAESVLHWVQQAQLDIPVIIVSGGIGEEAAVKAMKAGASDCVMKDNLVRLPLWPLNGSCARPRRAGGNGRPNKPCGIWLFTIP